MLPLSEQKWVAFCINTSCTSPNCYCKHNQQLFIRLPARGKVVVTLKQNLWVKALDVTQVPSFITECVHPHLLHCDRALSSNASSVFMMGYCFTSITMGPWLKILSMSKIALHWNIKRFRLRWIRVFQQAKPICTISAQGEQVQNGICQIKKIRQFDKLDGLSVQNYHHSTPSPSPTFHN